MSAITIVTVPRTPQVLTGESLVVDTLTINDGGAPVLVHDEDQPSQFSYQLRSLQEGGPRYFVSQSELQFKRAPGETRTEIPAPRYSLSPKRRISRMEDLADLADGPFAPGVYELTVEYKATGETVRSERAVVDVIAPKISHVSSVVCPDTESVTTVFTHVDEEAGTAFLQRESMSRRPQYGVFHRRHTLAGEAAVTGLTTAVDTASMNGGRWLAWLEGPLLGGVKGWGNEVMEGPATIDTGLHDAVLARPGIQLADYSTLFWVAGGRNGENRIQQYAVSKNGWRRAWDAALGTGLPGRVLAQYRPGAKVTLVWTEAGEAGVRLCARSWGMRGEPLEPEPRVLLEAPGPLAAWEIEPVAQGGNGAVNALYGPDKDGRMSYVRLPLEGAAEEPVRFASPRPPGEAWAILGSGGGDWPVIVKSGPRLLLMRVRAGGQWAEAARNLPSIEHLQLLTMSEGKSLWAQWVDPAFGIKFERVTPP